jgi:hypothetical protein
VTGEANAVEAELLTRFRVSRQVKAAQVMLTAHRTRLFPVKKKGRPFNVFFLSFFYI